MPKISGSTTFAVLSAGAVVAGCQSAPARYADTGVHATYTVAATGAGAVHATGVELYHGAGTALRAPLHDLNLMQDKIAPVLLRAEDRPYDLVGVNSCGDVLNQVAELDLALGPDVDTPKQKHRTRVSRGADFAASTALDAAGTAAEHFIPMRGTIKQISGAKRYENHVKHAVLAGETRRSFLKAIGMSHNCSWPAAPLAFTPIQAADISAPWTAPAPPAATSAGGPVLLASTASPGSAVASRQGVAPSIPQVVKVAYVTAPRPAAPDVSRRLTPVSVQVHERLPIPAAMTAKADPSQAWRPASRRADGVEVSQPLTTTAVAASSGAAGAAAPWSAASAFSSASAVRP